MCNCIIDNEASTLQWLKDRAGESALIEKGDASNGFQNLVVNMRTGVWRGHFDYRYNYQRIKKDKTPGRIEKKTIAVHFTYCPFCGVKYEA
ncbi:hypothetical protein [Hymenobacter fodinae]|uniref:Uncharacterized protein n=1 Tax=Hymenobacter fodinae TaxID=2510796 RepID=A0A4Z0P3X7_9BACT|nr:hypothetical protein [Hymenobacter fodinae]TGE05605.1 hypothetical protein EU556_20095 [Hymenobacter fodinae]